MDEKIIKLAWNIIQEHNTVTKLLTVPEGNLNVAVLAESRQRAMEFVARLIDQTLQSW